ncbi:hypothetical protein DRQ09_08995, partial [candidate division KSB1 bacterium]
MKKLLFLLILLLFNTLLYSQDTIPDKKDSLKTGLNVKIMYPEFSSEFKTLEPIYFIGYAFDYKDKIIPSDSLIWESDKDGIIGKGTQLKKTLSANLHRIIFRAKNNGFSKSDTTYILVKERYINEPPRVIKESPPVFPEEITKKGIQGIISLSLQIDKEGKVKNVDVIKNTTYNKECEKAAVSSAYNTVFSPAKEFGVPKEFTLIKEYGVGSIFENPELAKGIKISDRLRKELASKNEKARKKSIILNPAPITKVFPFIKRKDLRIKTQGKINLCVKLNKDGNISSLIIHNLTFKDKKYIRASVLAAFKSKYRPALKRGKPVETYFIIPYTFGYNNKDSDIEDEIWQPNIKEDIVFPEIKEYTKPEFRLKEVDKAIKNNIEKFSLIFKIDKKGKVKDIFELDKEKVKKIKGLK